MKKILILGLALMVIMTLSFTVIAAEGPDDAYERTGTDPLAESYDAGWVIDVGSLEGWTSSNFETLSQQESGVSEIVGEGVTVIGTNVKWDGPSDVLPLSVVGPPEFDFEQVINYEVNAYAEIPCYLEMNIFGNGGWMKGKSIGQGAVTDVEAVTNHYMLFHTNFGGVLDEDWNFVEQGDHLYSSFSARDRNDMPALYIHACDLWTANLFGNVPYGFSVASAGLGSSNQLPIHMRHVIQDELDFPDMDAFSSTDTLTADGVEIAQFAALHTAQINMQFRVPYANIAAGVYTGTVTFSMYSI